MEDVADVWPEGGLFGYSGVDGRTCLDEPFVAAGLKQRLGWQFWLDPALTLAVHAGEEPTVPRRTLGDICLADCWRFTVVADEAEGVVEGAFIDHQSIALQAAFHRLPAGEFPDVRAPEPGIRQGLAEVFRGPDWWVAVWREPESLKRRFGIAISYVSQKEAVDRAMAAAGIELNEAVEQRLAFYRSVPVPEALAGNTRRAYYKAVAVHKVSTVRLPESSCRGTLPCRMPRRPLAPWDSAFHALGMQYLGIDHAQDAIRAALAWRRPEGRAGADSDALQQREGPHRAQPPMLAWSVCRQSERVINSDFLLEVYPKLVDQVLWHEANRKNGNGLYGWRLRIDDDPVRGARGAESGMDNSPRFDRATAVTAVDLSSYMASEYHSLEKLARCLDKPQEAVQWQQRRLDIAERINDLLWDDESRFYYDLDQDGEMVLLKTAAGFLPLLGQVPDRDRAEALRMHLMNPNEFWAPLPIPTVSLDEPLFGNDMWRGPVWMNVNCLVYYGLMAYGFFQEARQLARISVQEIVRMYMKFGCFYEFYDALTVLPPTEMPRRGAVGDQGGAAAGAIRDYHWTAAAYTHLSNEVG